jgi:hypothetical protein
MFNLFRCTSGLAPPWATLGSQDDNAPSITVNEVYGKTLFDLNVLYVVRASLPARAHTPSRSHARVCTAHRPL